MGGGGGGISFEGTPSWIVGLIVFVIVGVSLVVEKLIHHLGVKLQHNEKKHLYEALVKIKDELMLLGFVSLILAFLQDKIGKVCVPDFFLHFWLPCGFVPRKNKHEFPAHFQVTSSGVLSNRGRHLLSAGGAASCPEGKVPFISLGVLHDLHYLIFILAVVHVITCTVTVLLGEIQISQWWKWEEDIRKKNQLADANKAKVIDIRSLTFIKERFEGVDANKRNYVSNFFKHLCGIVTQADYEAMRFGFVLTHCHGNQRFNFHRYIVYAYEGDFEEVVSISWFLWLLVVISLSLNVAGWHIYMWMLTTALILLLVVGTKLQQVITELATHVAQRHTVIVGDISIKPSDEYFWFQQPKIFLFFIHCVIFLNSYSLAIFFWVVVSNSLFILISSYLAAKPNYSY
uniref:MLO-like protein n=1 Tax=Opuntia streptacantha TaxID=393608 RepID=A0A7C9FFW7_OPUST